MHYILVNAAVEQSQKKLDVLRDHLGNICIIFPGRVVAVVAVVGVEVSLKLLVCRVNVTDGCAVDT